MVTLFFLGSCFLSFQLVPCCKLRVVLYLFPDVSIEIINSTFITPKESWTACSSNCSILFGLILLDHYPFSLLFSTQLPFSNYFLLESLDALHNYYGHICEYIKRSHPNQHISYFVLEKLVLDKVSEKEKMVADGESGHLVEEFELVEFSCSEGLH